jgi:hypothetical protein
VKLGQTLSRLDRAQRSLPFKILASIVLVTLAIAAFSTYYVVVTLPGQRKATAAASQPVPAEAPTEGGKPGEPGKLSDEDRSAIEAAQRIYGDLLAARTSPTNLGLGLLALSGAGLVVIWLGLGLTYVALGGAAAMIAYPLSLLGLGGLARLVLGIIALTAAFTALMQGLRAVLSGPGPVFAIARNALLEATRMKISLVFIVLLIFGLAYLPALLSTDTPLRYRVQSFLQYATAGSFWIIAVLALFFAAASVSFEQRDKQIWQTMTKPVASWQYILGKWLGVSGLAAVLLTVCCSGIFMFTEYLRQQPAVGESAHLAPDEAPAITEDRRILETQVLTAREVVRPDPPIAMDDPSFLRGLEAYIADNRSRDPEFAKNPTMFGKVADDLYKNVLLQWRTIDPGAYRSFNFRDLGDARRDHRPLTLRYRINAGSNSPDQLYKITFVVGGLTYPPQEATLGPTHSLSPLVPSLINEKGEVEVIVHNSSVDFLEGRPVVTPNAGAISIPPDGLELTYPAGSYQMNFVRVAFVLWVKLAFLAILAIAAATFLSFPVACLVAFSVFMVAEGAGFLSTSLENYSAVDVGEKVIYYKVFVRAIGLAVARMFRTYADLRPTGRLVDGRLLGWVSVAWGTIVLIFWSALLYMAAVLIFRKRELATYSGQ